MQDISGIPSAGQQLINGYGDGGFRVSGIKYEGSVLVLPEKTLLWDITSIADITVDSLNTFDAEDVKVEILLIGCGTNMAFIDTDIRNACREKGIVIDAMDTGAAVRTYNVLLLEGRQVAAALVAV
ncbi:Mth938-like domain-containing protein [Sneathiella marina]|uniref:Mth938-like domain-containing protein n=1 Tax=Sneathiella marina TaxID=2950108 RepID=A0ABY4VY66_9PROT|nr:Mth938-like domain-containing protein [Sneathiella marina]USG59870.1 Mth938-like domain-containing protein [Sneathiella marina]